MGTKKVSKKLPFKFTKKKNKKTAGLADSNFDGDEDDEPTTTTSIDIAEDIIDPEAEERAAQEQLAKKGPWVEFRMLVSTGTDLDETSGIGTTVSSLGQLALRSGNRNPPTILFGAPKGSMSWICPPDIVDPHFAGVFYAYYRSW